MIQDVRSRFKRYDPFVEFLFKRGVYNTLLFHIVKSCIVLVHFSVQSTWARLNQKDMYFKIKGREIILLIAPK